MSSRARGINLWVLLGFFLCAGTALVVVNTILMFGVMKGEFGSLCAAAERTYERGGTQALRLFLEGVNHTPGRRVRVLDGAGRDVLTGQPPPPGDPRPPLAVAAGGHTCVATLPGDPPLKRFGPMSWVLPFVSILCCTVGAFVTWRMRRIEAVVTHFGAGELAARISSDSGDAIGRLARAFNRMAERIETLVSSNQRLCADMAHELRSPLTRLLLAIPGARRGAPDAINRIETEAVRMDELVNELLDLSRAEADPRAVELEPVDAAALLFEIAEHCSIEAIQRGCRIRVIAPAPETVIADVELLRRAIENVLRNAVRHAPGGSAVLVSCSGDAEAVTVGVRDHGPGVPEAALAEIFRPFYRVDAARRRSTGGAGLGLAIAQRAIAVHGGNIQAENANPGLAVTIRLPRNKDH